MSNSNDTDDFEALIDRAVDTFFVEGPADGQVAAEEVGGDEQTDFDFSGEESSPPAPAGKDDLTQAVDSLFMDSFSASLSMLGTHMSFRLSSHTISFSPTGAMRAFSLTVRSYTGCMGWAYIGFPDTTT